MKFLRRKQRVASCARISSDKADLRTCKIDGQRGDMQTINELFATSVERYGNRPALIEPVEGAGMATLTYRALQERVHGFAGYLQTRGLEKGNCIVLWSASRSDWMAAYLGALLLGVIVVPLDVNSREDFLTRVVETTEAKLLITTQKQYTSLKKTTLPLVDIDALPQETLDTGKLPVVHSYDLAEVVFTS